MYLIDTIRRPGPGGDPQGDSPHPADQGRLPAGNLYRRRRRGGLPQILPDGGADGFFRPAVRDAVPHLRPGGGHYRPGPLHRGGGPAPEGGAVPHRLRRPGPGDGEAADLSAPPGGTPAAPAGGGGDGLLAGHRRPHTVPGGRAGLRAVHRPRGTGRGRRGGVQAGPIRGRLSGAADGKLKKRLSRATTAVFCVISLLCGRFFPWRGGGLGHGEQRPQQQLSHPDEEQQHQNGDEAGGDNHHRQRLQQPVHHGLEPVDGAGHRPGDGAGHLREQAGQPAGGIGVALGVLGGLLGVLRRLLGLGEGGGDGCLVGPLDESGDPDAGRDHQSHRQSKGRQPQGQPAQAVFMEKDVDRRQAAGGGDQQIEGRPGGDGQQVLFQKNGAQDDEKIAAEVGQLLRNGGGQVAGQQGDGGGARRGCGGQVQNGGLLLLQRGQGGLVKAGVGGGSGHHKDGQGRNHQPGGGHRQGTLEHRAQSKLLLFEHKMVLLSYTVRKKCQAAGEIACVFLRERVK